jgi:uncharacterized membrane protein
MISALSLVFFLGSMFYARFKGQADKAQTPPSESG